MIEADFHAAGILFTWMDRLNIMKSGSTITCANSLNILGCELSGPGDLFMFRSWSFFVIISFVIVSSNSLLIRGFSS